MVVQKECLNKIDMELRLTWSPYIAASKYFSASHYEHKNKKTAGQIKFLTVTIKQQIKLVSTTFSM